MKYKKYKTEEEQKKKKKKFLAIFLPIFFGVAAAVSIPLAVIYSKNPVTPTPEPEPTPTPTPTPYTGPTFKFSGTKLLGFADKVTQSIILERFPNGSVTIPECTEVADGAFDGKFPNKITKLFLPSNTTIIGNNAFANNPNITNISFYENKDISDWKVTSLGDKAFYNTGIESFTTPFDLAYIGNNCFDKCSNLKYIDLRISDSASRIKFDTNSFSNLAESGTVVVRTKTSDYWKNALAQAGLVNKEKSETEFSDKWKIIEYSCIDVDDQGVCYGFKRDIPQYLQFLIKLESNPLIIPDNVVKLSNLYGGFSGHDDIVKVIIPSTLTTIEEGCFKQCGNINSIDISSFKTVPQWVGKKIFEGCNEKGIFTIIQDNKTEWKELLKSVSGLIIDSNHWKVGLDSIETEYCLGIYANEDSYISFSTNNLDIDINYSTDGKTWQKFTSNSKIKLSSGSDLYLQGTNPEGLNNSSNSLSFNITGNVSLKGNVMGLITGGIDELDTIPCDGCFKGLFANSSGITSISDDFLPATNITASCYESMFSNCKYLQNAPNLPANQLYDSCYADMFYECTRLVQIHDLNAMNLANNCYKEMFFRCVNLDYEVNLPATKLYENCYYCMFYDCSNIPGVKLLAATNVAKDSCTSMFRGCTKISKIELFITDFEQGGMYYMFSGCSSLNDVTVHFTSWPVDTTEQWLIYVSATGSFHCPKDLDIPSYGESYVPCDWKIN